MFLIRWALQNSFVVLAITLGLVFLGGAVVPGIPTDVLPDFKTPVVVSFFSYPGLPTLDMEKSVTSRVERALTLAGKLDKQESRTLPGASVLKITFQPGTNASSASRAGRGYIHPSVGITLNTKSRPRGGYTLFTSMLPDVSC